MIRNVTPPLLFIFLLFVPGSLCVAEASNTSPLEFPELTNKHFQFSEAAGIGREEGVTRRDPSDVIKVDGTCYVWYTKVTHDRLPERDRKLAHSGYVGTIWYATSRDEGHTWVERGEALAVGKPGTFDSHAVFTPNILKAEERYWLFYTGVRPTPGRAQGGFANNNKTDFTAIGLAVADTPDGPFLRISDIPVLSPSTPSDHPQQIPSKFDSYRIDDASLLIRGSQYWLYYKGRNMDDGPQGPRYTKMGVAIAAQVEGPYLKQNNGDPILDKSHEVLIWPHREGVAACASFSKTFEYAPDGLDFTSNPLHTKFSPQPVAPGACRPDLTNPVHHGPGIQWGIAMRDPAGPFPYLIRWNADLTAPLPEKP